MQITSSINVTGNGVTIQRTVQRTVEAVDSREITLPAGKAGTLSDRADNAEGELTMAGGHGITTASHIDIYWDGGVQRNCLVGTVSGNTVPFAGGAGDDLPAEDTAIVACIPVAVNLAIDTSGLSLLAIELARPDIAETAQACVRFREADTSEVTACILQPNVPQIFDVGGMADNDAFVGNPLDADVASLVASNGSSSNAATLRIIVGSDATP